MTARGGRSGWQRVGTEWRDEGCVCKVISTKSVPYDTHSHGLCLDSLFLSVCLSPLIVLSLPWLCNEGKEVGVEGRLEVDISQPPQELCDDRGQAMSHTRDSGGSSYHAERASLNTFFLSALSLALCPCSSTRATHHCWGYLLCVQNTCGTAAHAVWICTYIARNRRQWVNFTLINK